MLVSKRPSRSGSAQALAGLDRRGERAVQ